MHMCVEGGVGEGADKTILWLCVGSECAASTSVERSSGLRVPMQTGSWFSLKKITKHL